MRYLFLFCCAILLFSFVPFQAKQYSCLPCGQACDKDIYSQPGECRVCMMKLIDRSALKFKNLSVAQFCDRIAAGNVIILDVRTPEEFKGTMMDMPSFGHFKGAININVEELEGRIGELSKYKEKEVLVYCSHNHRSPRASYILNTHGFKNVSNMTGGVSTITNVNDACLKKTYVPHKP